MTVSDIVHLLKHAVWLHFMHTQGRCHPDNDPGITRCSRCGCPPEAHEVAEHEQVGAGHITHCCAQQRECSEGGGMRLPLLRDPQHVVTTSHCCATHVGMPCAYPSADILTSLHSFLPPQERELGNDAFALRHYDAAVTHYSRALGMCATDAALWSNRAAAYLAKGW